MDFTVAYHKDLLFNAPVRTLKIAGSALQQAGEFAVETAAMAHDTAVLGADAALRYTTGEGFEDITLYSSLAENSAQRIARGDSTSDIIKDSALNIGANALTVGTYGTLKEQFELAADYMSGNVSSIQEVEDRLIHAAGGAVLNAGLGMVGSRVAGQGWMGKPISVPKPSVVLEGVSQLPGRARAAAGRVSAQAKSAYAQVKTVLQSEVQIQPQFGVASSFGAGSIKFKLVPPKAAASKGVPEAVGGVSRHVGPKAFRRANPEYASGYEIHHSVEWNALQRYPRAFTPEQLNLESMMRPLRIGQTMRGRNVHRSFVRKSWDNFRDLFQERYEQGLIHPDKMRQLLLRHRDFIDRMYFGKEPGR